MRPKEADYNQKVWQGASERALYSEYASIGEILFNSMSAFPANICQVFNFRFTINLISENYICNFRSMMARMGHRL